MNYKKISTRASAIGTLFECTYKAKLQSMEEDSIETEALRTGTNTHTVLLNKISEGKLPLEPMTEEEEDNLSFLHVPAEFERLDLSRASSFISLKRLRNVPEGTFSVECDSDVPFEISFQSRPTLDDYKADIVTLMQNKKVGFDISVRERKGEYGINFMSKTSGAHSSIKITGDLSGVAHKETTIYEAVNKNMFSRELIDFEKRTSMEYSVLIGDTNYTLDISGQFDCIGDGIMVDIKTSKSKPAINEPATYMKYVVQQAMYAVLNNLKDVKFVLLYIVKQKVPKLIPVAFTFSRNKREAIETLLVNYVKIVEGMDTYTPERSLGVHCKWCHFKKECFSTFPLYPNLLSPYEIEYVPEQPCSEEDVDE